MVWHNMQKGNCNSGIDFDFDFSIEQKAYCKCNCIVNNLIIPQNTLKYCTDHQLQHNEKQHARVLHDKLITPTCSKFNFH